ncbi:MAG: MFS transporter [Candidatus Methanofastidiosa archaeon]|nr:MFS transporter [Candidatus Methanofastidiosa archaeon]
MEFKYVLGFRRYRALAFGLIGLVYILVFFHRNATAVVAIDMMQDLNAEAVLLGLLAGGYFYSYAFMQLPTGLLSDSWGVRKTIAFTTLIAGVGSIVFGMSTNIGMAVMGRVIVGIGVSTVYVCALKFISQWYKKDEFATMNGVLVALGGIGLLISTMPLAYLSELLGWRSPFIIIGVVTIALCALVWMFVRNKPEDMEFKALHPVNKVHSHSSIVREGIRILRTREFWPLAIWLFCGMSIYISFGGLWGGPYLIQTYGLSKIEASRILSMIAVGMIFGSPFLGFLSDKVLKRRRIVILSASSLLLLNMLILTLFTGSLPIFALYLSFFVMGVVAIGINPLIYATVKDIFPLELAGTSTGLANFFPFIGGAIYQPLLGYILEANGKVGDAYTLAGYRWAIAALLITSAIAFVSTLLIRERKPE